MESCSSKNLLAHIVLNSLPDTDVFKKARDFISSYLSDIGRKKGGAAKPDINYIKRSLIHIEADKRAKNQPTSQSINTSKNRRAFGGDEGSEDRCLICNRPGHVSKGCKSPCWHCKKPGHRNHDCPTIKGERGRSQSRQRGRHPSSSRNRDNKGKSRKNSPASPKKKKQSKSKNNRTTTEDSENNVSSETDIERSETEEESPEKGE